MKTCKQCGRSFHSPRPAAKYCSIACVGAAKRVDSRKHDGPATERICSECGRTFIGKTGKFCRPCIVRRAGVACRLKHPLTGDRNPLWKGGITNTLDARRRWRQTSIAKSPEKWAARAAVRQALRKGDLTKQPCVDCGSDRQIEAHHHDYTKPLDVTWLCRPCHLKRHGKLQPKEGQAQIVSS